MFLTPFPTTVPDLLPSPKRHPLAHLSIPGCTASSHAVHAAQGSLLHPPGNSCSSLSWQKPSSPLHKGDHPPPCHGNRIHHITLQLVIFTSLFLSLRKLHEGRGDLLITLTDPGNPLPRGAQSPREDGVTHAASPQLTTHMPRTMLASRRQHQSRQQGPCPWGVYF